VSPDCALWGVFPSGHEFYLSWMTTNLSSCYISLMTEEELKLAVESVRRSLSGASLNWILREVDETLRLGKPTIRTIVEVKQESEDLLYMPAASTGAGRDVKPGRRRTAVPTTEAYTTAEQLALLLDAIQRTAVATADMQSYVLIEIANRDGSSPAAQIIFERDGEPSSSISNENKLDAVGRIDDLRHAVQTLRERLD
jgi:hypothetical protein